MRERVEKGTRSYGAVSSVGAGAGADEVGIGGRAAVSRVTLEDEAVGAGVGASVAAEALEARFLFLADFKLASCAGATDAMVYSVVGVGVGVT